MQDPDTETAELFTQLAGGGIHLLCFADPDSVCTTQLMQDGAGLDETERRLFCERVNTEDATGCLWPLAKLSALPARFLAEALADSAGLERCLQIVFDLNARLCRCPALVVDLREAVSQRQAIEAALTRMHAACTPDSLVREWRTLTRPRD